MVEGIVRLLDSNETSPINLGNPREMTILQFAHKVLKVTDSQSEIIFITPTDERTKDDPMTRQPDITKAQQVMDWEPVVSLEEGLRWTMKDFKARI